MASLILSFFCTTVKYVGKFGHERVNGCNIALNKEMLLLLHQMSDVVHYGFLKSLSIF